MASAGWAWMAEVAGEELAKLEAAHPGRRFAPLKAELERLVAEPALDAAAFFPLVSPRAATTTDSDSSPAPSQPAPSSPAAAVCTQESSTQKRKPPAGGAVRAREAGKRRRLATSTPPPGGAKKDRAEVAIERAERCLERIRAIKRGLLAAWIH